MGVGAADQPELERVDAQVGAELQPALKAGSRVLAFLERAHALGAPRLPAAGMLARLRGSPGPTAPGLEVRELVGGGEHGVGLTVALDLGHLVEGLPTLPGAGVGGGQWFVLEVGEPEHLAVAHVAVVGDRQHLAAGRLLVAGQEAPQVFRVPAVVGAEGDDRSGFRGVVAEDDDPVEVAEGLPVGADRRPLVAGESGEAARLVVLVSQGGDPLPHSLPVGGAHGAAGGADLAVEGPSLVVGTQPLTHFEPGFAELPADLLGQQSRVPGLDAETDAQALGVISDDQEVERTAQADRHAVSPLDHLAACESVGDARVRVVRPDHVRVAGGVARVDVGVAPEDLGGVVCGGRGRVGVGSLSAERGCRRSQQAQSDSE